jgi:hypothetical protein
MLPDSSTTAWHITSSCVVESFERHSPVPSTPPLSANMSAQASPAAWAEGLRERNVTQAIREEESSGSSSGLDTPQDGNEAQKEKKTFGRTPSGTSKSAV